MLSSAISTPELNPEETTIFDIFRYCQRSFSRYGVSLSFPNNTDPKKTYKWRYLEGFLVKTKQLELSLKTAYRLIDAMVDYAHINKQLHSRGLAILSSASMLDIGYNSIKKEVNRDADLVMIIDRDLKFLSAYNDRLAALIHRENKTAVPNLIKWHMQGKLSTTFIAISKSCQIAIHKLSSMERLMLPKRVALYGVQRQCIANATLKHRLKSMLGDDWGVVC